MDQSKRVEITTVPDMLAKLRQGSLPTYPLRIRALEMPVRVVTNTEQIEMRGVVQRKALEKTKVGQVVDSLWVDVATMKLMLMYASTIPAASGVPMLSEKLLDELSSDELTYIYNEYMVIMDKVNPGLEQLTPEEFQILVDGVKKNLVSSKDCTLRQLKGIFTAYQDLIQRVDS